MRRAAGSARSLTCHSTPYRRELPGQVAPDANLAAVDGYEDACLAALAEPPGFHRVTPANGYLCVSRSASRAADDTGRVDSFGASSGPGARLAHVRSRVSSRSAGDSCRAAPGIPHGLPAIMRVVAVLPDIEPASRDRGPFLSSPAA